MAGRPMGTLRMMLAALAVVSLVLTSAGCLVEEEKVTAPKVPEDRKAARLVVDGQVATALNWTLEQVFDVGMEDFTATFVSSVGTKKTSNFTGVRVRAILDAAGLNATAEMLELEAADGYRATIFLSDVTNTTHLALKEEGQWQNLSDQGAMRLVDTRMGSVYWVKQVVALHLRQSATLALRGHVYYYRPTPGNQSITAGHLYTHATANVTWKEGTKTRTGRGMSMSDAMGHLNITASMLELLVPGKDRIVHPVCGTADFLAIDSKGRFVYVVDQAPLATGLSEIRALNGIRIFGDVMTEMNITTTDLDALPQDPVTHPWATGTGPSLASIVGLAGPMAGSTTVKVGPGDGTPLDIPIGNLPAYHTLEVHHATLEDSAFPVVEIVLVAQGMPPLDNWFVVIWIEVA